jgi:hypothetical protein
MTDVICPSCGKPNPADSQTCQFCKKPLAAESLPDWLGDLRGGEETVGAPSGEAQPASEDIFGGESAGVPDWLTRLEEQSGLPAAGTPPPAAPAAGQGEAQPADLPDWLKGMAPQEESAAPAQPAGDLPDWLSDMSAGAEAAFTPLTPEEAPAPSADEALPAADLPDWLSGIGAAPAAPAAEPAAPVGEDDWLASLTGETPAPAAEEPAAEMPAQPAEEVPDWLSGLGAGAGAPFAAAPVEGEPAQPAEEVPDWLAGLGAAPAGETPTPVAPEPPAAEQPAQPAEEVPDWLAGLGAGAGAAFAESPAEPAAQPPAQPSGSAPDWLSDMMGQPPAAEQPAPDWLTQGEAASPFTPESAPDWLSQEQPGEPAAAGGEAAPTPPSEMPDWLSGLGEQGSAAEPPAASGAVPAFTFEEEPPAGEAGAETDSHYLAALPDWVSDVSAEDTEAAEADANLKPADLPDWLEAMRPVGAAAPSGPVEDVSGADVITAGPLTGLRGVLDAEPDAARPRKPAAYSIKLRITDDQQGRIDMLTALLAGEDQAKPLPAPSIFKLQYVFRLLVALVLMLPIFWAVATNGQRVPLPEPDSLPAVNDLQNLLGAVQSDSPVLVAFDYEPGFAGEMNLAASSILRRLADQGAYLALVSSSPTGPALAESMLAALNDQPERSQNPFTNYANLGYIAGGPAGLRLLNEKPREVLPYDLKGNYAWSGAPLDAVATLADFRMLVIITDNAETARTWIEQVGPALKPRAPRW